MNYSPHPTGGLDKKKIRSRSSYISMLGCIIDTIRFRKLLYFNVWVRSEFLTGAAPVGNLGKLVAVDAQVPDDVLPAT